MSILCATTRAVRNLADRAHKWVYRNHELPSLIKQYKPGVTAPWSPSYIAARNHFALQQINSPALSGLFAGSGNNTGFLPEGYGVSFDERCVEWPWALANMQKEETRVLDAGSALNHWHILNLPVWEHKKLDIYTLAPEPYCAPAANISYLFGDLRSTPYKNGEFTLMISISTLEHIGMDNQAYSGRKDHAEHDHDALFHTLSELKRIIKPGGRLLFTVPFGAYVNCKTFRQFDAALLARCREHFAPSEASEAFFLYSASGWQAVSGAECANASYVLSDYNPKNFAIQPDLAAAARAVACCRWRV